MIFSCNKQDDFLNHKKNKSDVIPKTLQDFQATLDNGSFLMNFGYNTLGLLGSDNYYISDNNFSSLEAFERNCYTWNKVIYEGTDTRAYITDYSIVANANVVLEGLQKNQPYSDVSFYNNVYGQALFFRSIAFYNLAQTYCKQYDKSTSSTDLGIVLRTTSDINAIMKRSTLEETYANIINDLKQAADILPAQSKYITRPTKPAAYALLSKTYLLMSDFNKSKDYSDSAIKYLGVILDFNSSLVSSSNFYSFPDFGKGNPEIIFYATSSGYSITEPYSAYSYVDTSLYASYDDNDLRKTYFYLDNGSNLISYIGTYTGDYTNFTGLATNELYLIRAECNARLNNLSAALNDLNTLLKNRFITNTYQNFNSADPNVVLKRILLERRKELPFTAQIRWEDLRRLNKDPRFAITLKRVINGQTYILQPNDPKYAYPIPPIEVERAGTQPNDR